MCRYALLSMLVALLVFWLQVVPTSRAAFPEDPPNDPKYDRWETGEGAAVKRIGQGTIPPEADLRNPDWFETLDPVKTPVIEIVGRAAATRVESYRYVVAFGIGAKPLRIMNRPVFLLTGNIVICI